MRTSSRTILNLLVTAVAAGLVATTAMSARAATGALLDGAAADGGLTLAWEAVEGASGYTVSRAGVPVATTTATSYAVQGLDNGEPEDFAVHADVEGVDRLVGSILAAASDVTPPELSGELRLRPLGDGSVDVRYTINYRSPDTVAYRIEVGGELVARLPATRLQGTVHVTGLAEGVVQYVEMLAEDVVGNVTGVSGRLSVDGHTSDIRIPPVPVGLRISACRDQVELAWEVFGGLTGEASLQWDVYRDGQRLGRVDRPAFTDTRSPDHLPVAYEVRAVRPGWRASLPSHAAVVSRPLGPNSRCVIQYQDDDIDLTGSAHGNASVLVGEQSGASLTIEPDAVVAGAAVYVDGVLVRADGLRNKNYPISSAVTFATEADGSLPTIEIALFDSWGRLGARQVVTPVTTVTRRVPIPHDVTAVSSSDVLTLTWSGTGADRYLVTSDGILVASVTQPNLTLPALAATQVVTLRVTAIEGDARSLPTSPLRIAGWTP